MATKHYTVKKLAELSGVSVRALHFYDEIGLLKPSHYGDNGYRYYGEEELLRLQQILFYRELGFPLGDIQKALGNRDFDPVEALRSHRQALEKSVDRTHRLIRTIDETISKLKGEKAMTAKSMFQGFDPAKQAEYEKELVDRYGQPAATHIQQSKRRTKHWTKDDWARVGQQGEVALRGLTAHVEKGTPPSDPEVQLLVRGHYQWVCNFWTPNRESYTGLGQLYVDDARFRKFYEPYHPKLVDYLAAAMKIFADTELE